MTVSMIQVTAGVCKQIYISTERFKDLIVTWHTNDLHYSCTISVILLLILDPVVSSIVQYSSTNNLKWSMTA